MQNTPQKKSIKADAQKQRTQSDGTALNRPLTAAEIKQYLPSFFNWPTMPPTDLQQQAINQVIRQHQKAEEAAEQKQAPCNTNKL